MSKTPLLEALKYANVCDTVEGTLDALWVHTERGCDWAILDGHFTVEELEAIVAYLKDKRIEGQGELPL